MKVVALAGGVGGAKLADGLNRMLEAQDLTVIVNTGDDFVHFGLRICPDLDTVCYTLAGLANPQTGWGLEGETWNAISAAEALGGPAWFRIGDRDLGTHLERTRRLGEGQTLSQVTLAFCGRWGVQARVLPMSETPVSTMVHTSEGVLPFQEYFVHRQCSPQVTGFRFEGVEAARPPEEALAALEQAELVVICPSNPWVSIDPILAVPGIGERIRGRTVVAVSPIIAGKTVKGPAAKMYGELGIEPSALAVASQYEARLRPYEAILSGFVLDEQDIDQVEAVRRLGCRTLVTGTLMKSPQDRQQLAGAVLSFGESLRRALLSA